jgi:hypothetical protein
MRRSRKFAGFAAALSFSAAIAAGQQVSGPLMGYLVDSRDSRVHSILGVPGAAILSEALESGPAAARAVSPTGAYVLAANGSSRLPALWLPSAELRPLPGVAPAAERVALSPEGGTAAFYYASENRILVVSGLPDQPSAPAAADLLPLGFAVENFAVSDDGKLLLCAGRSGGMGVAAVVNAAGGEVNRVVFPRPISALAFAAQGHDALLAAGAEAVLIRHVDKPASRIPLIAGDMDMVSALALSRDGHKAFLASARSGKIAVLRLDGNEPPVFLDCGCTPEGFFRMNENGIYRLTEYAGSTVRLLDVTGTPRILALPPSIDLDRLP